MADDDPTTELPIVVVEQAIEASPDSVPQPAVIASHAAPRRRRRWPWVVLAVVLVTVIAIAAGGLWYISGLIGDGARVARADAAFPMSVTSVEGARISYRGGDGGWDDQGLIGIATAKGGYLQTADPDTSERGGDVSGTRTVTADVLGAPPVAGDAAALDGWYFPRNPKLGLGLDYADVAYDAPLGPTPAWLIPGTSTTWVIFTHGRGATPLEGLRIANTVSPLGYPMLLIRYRNDALAPAGNGYGQFGVGEWQDLEAAVQYALDNGAEHVVLAGASMGGSISLAFLQNSPLADRVVGAFLDAPLSSFPQVVRSGATDMGLPAFAADLGLTVASWRYGFDGAATDYTADAAAFTTPMLIVQGTADATVPPAVNIDFAAAANPTTVSLELFEGAGHVMSWNVDRPRYEALLRGFLGSVTPGS
jgi:alpha-beta hydrolase superfamily lysophospholipase